MANSESYRMYRWLLTAIVTLSLLMGMQITWITRSFMAQGHYDFIIFYTGAEIVNAGKGPDLYDLSIQQAHQEKFKLPKKAWSVLPFNHAPYELLPFLPLAKLSFQTAHLVWSIISVVMLMCACIILLALTERTHRLPLGALMLAFYPTWITIKMGQDSAMSLLILLGVFASLKYHRDVVAGGILALGLYKPQLVLPLAGILLVSRNWQTLIGFAATAAFLAAISFAMVGWEGILGLFSILSEMDHPTTIVYPAHMANLRGFFFSLLSLFRSAELTNIFTAISSLIVYGYTAIMWKNNASRNSPLFDLQFSLAIAATVLISYHLYPHDVIVLVIPIVLTFNYVLAHQPRLNIACNVFLFVLVLLYLPFVPILLEHTGSFGSLVAPILIMYGVLIFEIGCHRSSYSETILT
jgi:Glycosyltransferase family 87